MRTPTRRYDADSSGHIEKAEVTTLVKEMCPDASPLDCTHIGAILDFDGNEKITLEEFSAALEESSLMAKAVGAAASLLAVLYLLIHGGRSCLLVAKRLSYKRPKHPTPSALISTFSAATTPWCVHSSCLQARNGQGDSDLMATLEDYLTENEVRERGRWE